MISLFFGFDVNGLPTKSETIMVYKPEEQRRRAKLSKVPSRIIAWRSVMSKRDFAKQYILGSSRVNELKVDRLRLLHSIGGYLAHDVL